MSYSYVLLNEQDGRFYIGSTGDLRVRLRKHSSGVVRSTAHRRPLRLIYDEGCSRIDDARRRELEKAVALRPDYADALNNLGVLRVRQEQYSEAQQSFGTCIKVAPNFDQAHLNLARLYVLLKEPEKAKEILRELLHQQPENRLAQQTLEMLN